MRGLAASLFLIDVCGGESTEPGADDNEVIGFARVDHMAR